MKETLARIIKPQSLFPIASRPWLLIGDFNQILSQQEHSSIQPTSAPPSGMHEMHNFFDTIDVQDVTARGALYTWKNKCPTNPNLIKLDRALINGAWNTIYPNSLAIFDPLSLLTTLLVP